MLKNEPHWAPGKRGWADQPLWVLQRFVNTRDVDLGYPGEEELTDAAVLREFLVEYAELDPSVSVKGRDLKRAIEVREAIRALLLANNHASDVPKHAVETLNDAVEAARLISKLDARGEMILDTCCTAPVDAAIGRLIAPMFRAMADGTWERLKACPRATCSWAFYDRSKNHSGTWCSMKVCGNREKVKAFRARQTPARAG